MKLNLQSGSYGSVKFRGDIVCAKTGRTIKRGREQTNLLFDQGLNNLATMSWPALFNYFVLGTGTTPTRRDSGVITFTRAGSVVTASANFFEAADVGRLLKFDSGEEMYVTGFTSGTEVSVNLSGSLAASEGTIYYVNRTSLGNESKRSNTLTSDSGDHGFSWNGTTGVLSTWKTIIFSAETETVTYREIGWSNQSSGANTINGAALLAGGGDTLVADQQYKVRLQLDRVIGPLTPRALAASDVVDAWTGSAEECVEFVQLNYWNSAGTIVPAGGFIPAPLLEPYNVPEVVVHTSSASLRGPVAFVTPSAPSGGEALVGKPMSAASYVSGSFLRDYSAVITPSEGNSINIRTLYLSSTYGQGAHRVLFADPQTKTSSQKLTLRFRKSWGRVLVN